MAQAPTPYSALLWCLMSPVRQVDSAHGTKLDGLGKESLHRYSIPYQGMPTCRQDYPLRLLGKERTQERSQTQR